MKSQIVERYRNPEELSRGAAERVVEMANKSVAARGRFHVALAGGSTPRRTYKLLGRPEFRQRIDWTKIEFFWGDERTVPPEHDDSNYGMVNRALLSKVPVPREHIHRLEAEHPGLDRAAAQYEQRIAQVFHVSPGDPPPAMDLALLGLGTDGHTASLFPHTSALNESSRWVVANEVPQLNTWRLTMTGPLLNQARLIMFLVAGKEKAGALAAVLEGRSDPQSLPAQLIRPVAGECRWLIDMAAGELLRSTPVVDAWR